MGLREVALGIFFKFNVEIGVPGTVHKLQCSALHGFIILYCYC